ncbi:hypothetical protein COX58_01195 [archaeon CG_4_10_14_0_2_um_filter_Archaea_38_6]|nr:MAG: hypothetical protein COS83_03505 [archaeon CG07_land_8_20_14_0_80_38_8]PJA22786.1 MAG: hypothetical protein COX58_01195 [archaeon CG_4_10_14_0_2_um_filter_Archaea_38_6]
MITNNPELINKLRNTFSLNLYEVKIWLALLSKGISTAGDLSDTANVPRSRTYDVLEGLEKKGFVIMKLTKPIKYLAVEPENVIENHKRRILNRAEVKVKSIENFRGSNLVKELTQLHSKGIKFVEPTDLSGVIKGRNNIYNYMNNLIRNSESQIIISTSVNGFIRKIKAFKEELEKAGKRGVNVRIITTLNEEGEKYLNEINNVRVLKCDNNVSRFLIVDEKDVLFLLMNDEEVHPRYDVGLWVKSDVFGKSLNNMFNYMWEKLN